MPQPVVTPQKISNLTSLRTSLINLVFKLVQKIKSIYTNDKVLLIFLLKL